MELFHQCLSRVVDADNNGSVSNNCITKIGVIQAWRQCNPSSAGEIVDKMQDAMAVVIQVNEWDKQ